MNEPLPPKQITDTDLCAAYGAIARAGRNTLGLSQGEFSGILGIHRTTLLRLEQGLPPLRTGLCQSVVEVLAQAGFICQSPEVQSWRGERTVSNLTVTITAEAISNAQRAIDGQVSPDKLTEHFWGKAFVPPLQDKPLRRR